MKTKTLIATAALAIAAMTVQSKAALVITLNINTQNPNAVYIDFAGTTSLGTDTNTMEKYGIDLQGFFVHNIASDTGSVISGDTKPNGSGTVPFSSWASDDLQTGNYRDLNLFAANSTALESFVLGSTGFTQNQPLVIDLSGHTPGLDITPGDFGAIYSGNATGGGNTLIGNWNIVAVPEPSTYALFGLGALALVVVARRKQTA